MNSTFRTISMMLLSSIIFTQVGAARSASATPQQNTKATPQQNTNQLTQGIPNQKINTGSVIASKTAKPSVTTDFPKLKLCNFTSNVVHYSINGSNSSLGSSACVTWKLNNIALLSFDKLFTSGYQKQTYELSAGQYIFQGHDWGNKNVPANNNNPNGLNLFKFQSVSSS